MKPLACGNYNVKTGKCSLIDARTGQPADPANAAALRPVRVNNAIRRAAEAAMGSLTLFSANDAERRKAAEAVFKSRDPAGVPALTRALAAEKNASVRAVMEQARAAALLATTDASEPDRLAAIATLRARGDLDARGLLASLKDQPAAVATAAQDAVTAIDRQQQIWSVAQGAFYGLSLGSVLLLAAAGLAITFGVMGVINMAHGEIITIGAYTTFVIQDIIRTSAPALFDYSLFLAVPTAFSSQASSASPSNAA
jgi:urea transport system permease protein